MCTHAGLVSAHTHTCARGDGGGGRPSGGTHVGSVASACSPLFFSPSHLPARRPPGAPAAPHTDGPAGADPAGRPRRRQARRTGRSGRRGAAPLRTSRGPLRIPRGRETRRRRRARRPRAKKTVMRVRYVFFKALRASRQAHTQKTRAGALHTHTRTRAFSASPIGHRPLPGGRVLGVFDASGRTRARASTRGP